VLLKNSHRFDRASVALLPMYRLLKRARHIQPKLFRECECPLKKNGENISMYVCCLFNNIEFRANPPLYTIVKYIKTSVDSTMLKIRNEKKKNL
jgi:hypothetical protein